MLVTLSGMVIDVKPVQYAKAKEPMLVPPVITTVLSVVGTELLLYSYDEAPKI